jgi:hypothetical protein
MLMIVRADAIQRSDLPFIQLLEILQSTQASCMQLGHEFNKCGLQVVQQP